MVAILTSNKRDFKTKTVIRDKEGHCVLIKGSIQQENVIFVYLCTQHEKSESESLSVVSNPLQPHGLYSPWNSPGQHGTT